MQNIKKIRKNSFIILIITLIVLYFVLKDELDGVASAFSRLDYKFITIAFILYFVSILLRAYVNYRSINDKKKIRLKEAFKHTLILQFFNGVTPFSTGGQPMEVYMISKHNIKVSHATNIVIQNFIFYQIALVICGLIAVSYNFIFHLFSEVSLLKKLVMIGFIVNAFVAIALFFIAISEKFTSKCLIVIVKILSKIKVIKNKEEFLEKWEARLIEFHESAAKLRKRKWLFVYGVLLNIISLTLLYLIPLFIIYSLGDFHSVNAMDAFCASAYVAIMGAFIPIPGASGGIEYGFLKFFGNFIKGPVITTVLLIWRFITYYFGMIIGGIAFNFDKKGEKK